jgi:hypothetical protein
MLSVKPRGVVGGVVLSVVAVFGVGGPAGAGAAVAAGWTKPAVLVSGDGAALLGAGLRPDGSLRVAITDAPRKIALGLADAADPSAFADPLVVLRAPVAVGEVALAADGSGVTARFQRGAPSSVIAFDAAGAAQPPLALDDVGGATVAVAPGGAAVAAWLAKTAQGYAVDAAFRDPGSATFGAPLRAGYATGSDTIINAGIGDRGDAVVAWQANNFPSPVAAAVRLPAAAFSKAVFVSRAAVDAQLAVGPGGQAILVTGSEDRLDVSVKPPGAAAMPVARRLDAARQGFSASVAAGGERQVAVAWMVARTARGGDTRVRVYEGAAGGNGPRRIGTLGRDAGGDRLQLAVDPRGATVVAWQEQLKAKPHDPTARSHLGVAHRPAGGRFGATTYLGPVSLDDTPEAVLLAPGGRAYVAYEAFQPGDTSADSYRRVYVAERRP